VELSRARLFLAKGLRTVIENGLGLLGISAPEKM
jgi:arginyl-tRNA synthetase